MRSELVDLINFSKSLYGNSDFIPLHEPCFTGNENRLVNECLDSTFVSSVGKFVGQFEKELADFYWYKARLLLPLVAHLPCIFRYFWQELRVIPR